jgi:hypothetical protein
LPAKSWGASLPPRDVDWEVRWTTWQGPTSCARILSMASGHLSFLPTSFRTYLSPCSLNRGGSSAAGAGTLSPLPAMGVRGICLVKDLRFLWWVLPARAPTSVRTSPDGCGMALGVERWSARCATNVRVVSVCSIRHVSGGSAVISRHASTSTDRIKGGCPLVYFTGQMRGLHFKAPRTAVAQAP